MVDVSGVAAEAAGLLPPVEPVPVSPPDGAAIPNAFAGLHDAMERAANSAAGTEGWAMRDIPRLSPELWDDLMSRFGEGNVRVMVSSSGNFFLRDGKPHDCEPWVRGPILISPDGMEALRKSNASGTEARSGETEGLDPKGDGPVRDSADAQPPSETPNPNQDPSHV